MLLCLNFLPLQVETSLNESRIGDARSESRKILAEISVICIKLLSDDFGCFSLLLSSAAESTTLCLFY